MTCAQPDTATFKALNPEWQHTLEVELLRSMEYTSRWLVWAQTPDAHGEDAKPVPASKRPRNIPEPLPLPWDPVRKPTPSAMTVTEAADWLGWSPKP